MGRRRLGWLRLPAAGVSAAAVLTKLADRPDRWPFVVVAALVTFLLVFVILVLLTAPVVVAARRIRERTGATVALVCQRSETADNEFPALGVVEGRIPTLLVAAVEPDALALWRRADDLLVRIPRFALHSPRLGKGSLVVAVSTAGGDLELTLCPRRPGWLGLRDMRRAQLDELGVALTGVEPVAAA